MDFQACVAEIERLAALVDDEGRDDLAGALGVALEHAASLLEDEGDLEGAEQHHDAVIDRLDPITEGGEPHASALAKACFAKARHLRGRRETSAALPYFERAADLREVALPTATTAEIVDHVDLLNSLGYARWIVGDNEGALGAFGKAYAVYQRLPEGEARPLLGMLHLNTGNAHWRARRFDAALEAYSLAVGELSIVVAADQTSRYRRTLANALMGQSNATEKVFPGQDALFLNEMAIKLLREVAPSDRGAAVDLARALGNASLSEKWAGRMDRALQRSEEALAVLRDLVDDEGRPLHPGELADAQCAHAGLLAATGNTARAIAELTLAIPVLEADVKESGDAQLAERLHLAQSELTRLDPEAVPRARAAAIARGEGACSFCPKTRSQVARLIASDRATICDECLTLAAELIDERHPRDEDGERPEAPTPGPQGVACGFCGKTVARSFIAGNAVVGAPTTYICDACADAAMELLAEPDET